MRIEVAVMPGADAVSGAVSLPVVLDVAPEPAVELEPGLVLELEEQAATASAAAATTAMAGARSRFDLFIECLSFLFYGFPEELPSGLAGRRWLAPVGGSPAGSRASGMSAGRQP